MGREVWLEKQDLSFTALDLNIKRASYHLLTKPDIFREAESNNIVLIMDFASNCLLNIHYL